jgi:hypothetical protein
MSRKLARTGLGQPHEVLDLDVMIEFALFVRGKRGGLLALNQVPYRQLFRNPLFADRRFPAQPPRDSHFPDIAFAPATQVLRYQSVEKRPVCRVRARGLQGFLGNRHAL